MKFIRSLTVAEPTFLPTIYPAHYYGAQDFNIYATYALPATSNTDGLDLIIAKVEGLGYYYKEFKCYKIKPRIFEEPKILEYEIDRLKQKILIIKTIRNSAYEEAEEILDGLIKEDILKHENIFRTKPPIISPSPSVVSFLDDPYTISSEYGHYGIYTLHKMDTEETESISSVIDKYDFYKNHISKLTGIDKTDLCCDLDFQVYSISRNIRNYFGKVEEGLRPYIKKALCNYDSRKCYAIMGDKWMLFENINESEFKEPELSKHIEGPFDSEKDLLEALHEFIYSIPNTLHKYCETNVEEDSSKYANFGYSNSDEDYFNTMTDGQLDDYDQFEGNMDNVDNWAGH